jgi:hypothetical protein
MDGEEFVYQVDQSAYSVSFYTYSVLMDLKEIMANSRLGCLIVNTVQQMHRLLLVDKVDLKITISDDYMFFGADHEAAQSA